MGGPLPGVAKQHQQKPLGISALSLVGAAGSTQTLGHSEGSQAAWTSAPARAARWGPRSHSTLPVFPPVPTCIEQLAPRGLGRTLGVKELPEGLLVPALDGVP